jgi:hypothetical protein
VVKLLLDKGALVIGRREERVRQDRADASEYQGGHTDAMKPPLDTMVVLLFAKGVSLDEKVNHAPRQHRADPSDPLGVCVRTLGVKTARIH